MRGEERREDAFEGGINAEVGEDAREHCPVKRAPVGGLNLPLYVPTEDVGVLEVQPAGVGVPDPAGREAQHAFSIPRIRPLEVRNPACTKLTVGIKAAEAGEKPDETSAPPKEPPKNRASPAGKR
ncbi:MAG: hypothetical protein G01um101438_656 [Parcubacteria group bacterium Gr01-1014_38]|nr:MAG: hypothetical protein G01um101438_656 [Parcubacteria group bacterium Gr01-1014_38]